MRELIYSFIEMIKDIMFHLIVSLAYVFKKTFVDNTIVTFAFVGLIIVLSFYNSLPLFN